MSDVQTFAEQSICADSAAVSSSDLVEARKEFVSPRLEEIGDLKTLTLELGGTIG